MKGKNENKKQNRLENFRRSIVKIQNLEAKDKKSKNTLRQALRRAYNELEKRVEERTAYLMMTNKNLQQEIAERIRAEELLHYRIEFEKFIATLSSDFINLSSDEIPSAIKSSLQTIGEFVGVDCSFVSLFSEDETKINEIYKWCKKGIRFPIQDLKGCLIAEEFPWLFGKIKRNKVLYVSCSDELLNQSLYDFIPPRIALSNKERIDKAVKSNKPIFSNEGIGKSKVDTSYYPILDEEGKVVKLALICKKISRNGDNNNASMRQNDNLLSIKEMDPEQDFTEQSVEKKEETFKDLFITKHNHTQGECNFCFEGIISRNSKIWELFEILPSIAESVSTVLIQGESGTGKYLFASAIHNLSPRKNNPFITVNCGALPETLLESELFGYKAGAFTDARKDKPGRFALAEGGTLFLDEIGDISPAMQVRLLRFLQERVYEPLGSIESIKSDVRIISATNKDLEILVKEGKFREDLFYRINVVRLDLPPLRERLEDVPLLIADIIDKLNKQNGKKVESITEEALMCLLSYDYPGNVRELENIIEGAIVLCKSGQISPKHLPKHLNSFLDIVCDSSPIHKMEAAFLMNVLRQNNWSRVKTARQLGMHKIHFSGR